MFGAEIFVADLVGIGVVRQMGAIMVGVVMAGRTGAAFAAQLGTMQVNEEIDAFQTMSVSPVDFLVLPRMIGLTLMMPFLCIYADLMGTLGGLFVGVTMLDLGGMQYVFETKAAVGVNDLVIGLVQCTVYGLLISFSGCFRGMRCGRSSADVGRATTSSVVTSVVMMVFATALITVICDILGV
jgi:phospholipid/cholesterol/gamma-HCH transport system permease protein